MERSASHAGTSSSRGALPHNIAACSRFLPMRCQRLVAEALRLRNPGRVPLPTARGTAKGDGSPSSNGVYLKANEPGARLYFPYNKPPGSSRSSSSAGVSSSSTTTTTTVVGSSGATSSHTTDGSDSAGSGTVADLLLVSIDSEAQAHDATNGDGDAASGSGGNGGLVATLGILGGFALLLGGGYLCREPIKMFLDFFVTAVEDWGPWGYLAYAAVYTGLEVLAVPAIPLTMTAGVIFHPTVGTLLVSISGTLAATIAFLIARYAARDKVLKFARRHPRWAAIDRAIGRDGFKFVTLLRLSPLLPLAASNYLYGLTSVELLPYVLGSWIGMLPGTYAYVSAGHVGKAVLTGGEGALPVETWQIALGMSATLLAIGFVGKLAKQAIDEVEQEEKHTRNGKNN